MQFVRLASAGVDLADLHVFDVSSVLENFSSLLSARHHSDLITVLPANSAARMLRENENLLSW
jgi:hypothetical protein